MTARAWIRACSESRWHIIDSRAHGLAQQVLCGHIVWAPVHRRLRTPPVDAELLCEACQSATVTDVLWPTSDPDTTIRIDGLSEALALLDELDHNEPPGPRCRLVPDHIPSVRAR